MKVFFYLLLPMEALASYGLHIVGGLIVIFTIPWDWWKKSPASQPDAWIGKILPSLKISLRNLTLRIFSVLIFFFLLPVFLILPFILLFLFVPFWAIVKLFSRKRAEDIP